VLLWVIFHPKTVLILLQPQSNEKILIQAGLVEENSTKYRLLLKEFQNQFPFQNVFEILNCFHLTSYVHIKLLLFTKIHNYTVFLREEKDVFFFLCEHKIIH